MPKHRHSYSTFVPAAPDPRAVLLTGQTPEQSGADVSASLTELARLVEGLRIRVVHTVVQKRARTTGVLGTGKLREVVSLVARLSAEPGVPPPMVVVDAELNPGQLRLLQNEMQVEVADRTDIILRVFADRARTRTAQLEVELAQLKYQAPRVRDDDSLGGREGGGGRGERGHTNVQLRKQRIRERVATIERELAGMRPLQERQRSRRRDLPGVALVGYTNAGKSSLMRGLTGSEVLIRDELFATLGTTVRALAPSTTPRILVTDTVGFIKNLPHDLITSFRSTLDEARDADLHLYVVDAADPQWHEQLEITRATIRAIGASTPPALVLLNKIDRVDEVTRARLAEACPDAIMLNAHDGTDLVRLRAKILAFFDERMLADILTVPPTDGRLLADIRAHARVLDQRYDEADERLRLRVRALPESLSRWRRILPAPPTESAAALISLANQHGLSLTSDADTLDDTGLDFRVLHAHDEQGAAWILRTPRRSDVAEAAGVEARVLRLLRPVLPVAIPDWRLHAPDLIAYRRLPGMPAITLSSTGTPTWHRVDPAAPGEPFLDSVAAALAALQSVTFEAAKNAGIPVRDVNQVRLDLERVMTETRDLLRPSEASWMRWQRWLADDTSWPHHLALVHGDLHPGHLLLDESARLIGILDWTEACLTDPSVDLAMFFGCFGPAALEDLLRRFERAGGRIWPTLAHHAAERWAAFPASIAEWAQRTGNEAALAHARGLLQAQDNAANAD